MPPARGVTGLGLGAVVAAAAAAIAFAWGARAEPLHGMTSPQAMYLLRCSGCHVSDGRGAVSAGIPPFETSIGHLAGDAEGRLYMVSVPGVAGSGLSPEQKASVLNYIVERWRGEAAQPERFTSAEVARLAQVRPADVVSLRRRIVDRFASRGVRLADYPWR
ncbi:MAG: cytochrome C [Phenylobacterium sp.]|uniref:c-type cytochrome n=1 Tax=unclassified Phenylobacterium TaxID=2640670 RepID=UPI0012180364|nr:MULTISPECIES: hypothetical protein [unclassified Phenylobacterium]TAJ69371.1 MAG: cytochrome C [Phenylobacterium sp.]